MAPTPGMNPSARATPGLGAPGAAAAGAAPPAGPGGPPRPPGPAPPAGAGRARARRGGGGRQRGQAVLAVDHAADVAPAVSAQRLAALAAVAGGVYFSVMKAFHRSSPGSMSC